MSAFGNCPQCKKGIMRIKGNYAYASNPPQYDFRCEKCGYEKRDFLP